MKTNSIRSMKGSWIWEKKILDLDKKYENRSEDNKQENVIANQSETVITGLHSETTESEVTVMLWTSRA